MVDALAAAVVVGGGGVVVVLLMVGRGFVDVEVDEVEVDVDVDDVVVVEVDFERIFPEEKVELGSNHFFYQPISSLRITVVKIE